MTAFVGHEAAPPRSKRVPGFGQDVLVALGLFVPAPLSARFSGDARVVAMAVALLLVVAFGSGYLAVAAKSDGVEFYRWGLYTLLTTLFVQTAVLFLATLSSRRASLPALLTALPVIETIRIALLPAVALAEWAWLEHGLYFVCLAALLRALLRELDGPVARRIAIAVVTGGALWGTAQLVRPFPLFNSVADDRHERLNIEETYVRQERLVAEALDAVLPSLPDVRDTYFVGFAPYSAQNVFENEVKHIEELFSRKLGAAGRTALLINSRDTVDELPMANGHNLRAVLGGIVEKMDPEDLLFLHLTSHGSSDHELSVYFDNLGLNDISADELGGIVASADPPWRVVVVSACYSGGFIEALKSPRTLVITASSDDRQSFGCEHGREYTYFGEAFYRDSLADGLRGANPSPTPDFEGAFARAVEIVRDREASENLTPSEPQIWVGEEIAATLP